MQLDWLDKAILNNLIDDSRQSLRNIAKKTKVSVVTIMKRLKHLENEKLITNYSTRLDYDKLDYDFPVAVRISISKGKLFDVQKKIASYASVYAVHDITGDFDSLVLARFRNRRSLDTFLKRIQAIEHVVKTETNLILNVIKDTNLNVE